MPSLGGCPETRLMKQFVAAVLRGFSEGRVLCDRVAFETYIHISVIYDALFPYN